MFSRLPVWLVFVSLIATIPARAKESNGWPLFVQQLNADGTVASGEYLGPLLFQKTDHDGTQTRGFRPFYLHTVEGEKETTQLFYPFFTWQKEADYRHFSFFQLINFSRQPEPGDQVTRSFDIWPFYFSRDTGKPADSYRALFPLGGTIQNRFGKDRIHFVLFPLYADIEANGIHTTHIPWPFLRSISGARAHGFEFWPLFGRQGRAGDYDSQFYLWPLIYKSAKNLSEPEPTVNTGFLPFYTRDTAPGYIDETFVWPFFGYTHRTEPYHYNEQRYFWPLLVQGQGDRTVNRWAPIYTHSVNKGYDKTWVAWPVFRHARWEDAGIAQEQNQVLFFLYWSLTQRSTTNPAAAPAHKTHVWPLLSSWNNGAGRRQVQLLSPFEVFFPNNEPIRQLYSPLFALYRFDQSAPDDTRFSVLFNLLSWKKSPAEREFHFGPLFHSRSTPQQARVDLGLGLFSWVRPPGAAQWKFSLLDFNPKKDHQATAAMSP
jgi:hypothetical protein